MGNLLKQQGGGGIIIKVNNKSKRIFTSITTKWSLTIVAIISIVVMLILVANSLFLGDFYARKNKTLFAKEYETIKENYIEIDDDLLNSLRDADRKTGFLYYIGKLSNDQLAEIVMASIPTPPNVLPKGFPPELGIPMEQFNFINENIDQLLQGESLFGQIKRDLSSTGEFDLVFASLLDSSSILIITRPVEQLDEHSAITNQFLLIIGFLTILLSILIARISAQSVVKPIKEITKIGEHIANLDFTHRYTGHDRDEIGILGNSINRISTQLDSAMRELEETNNKLKVEMDLQRRFFAGVSHEFKTPVGLIRGYSESLQLGLAKTPEEIEEFSTIILEEADRLNHLITDILFLVKSESTEFVLDNKVIDIIPLIENALDKNSRTISEKQIEVVKEIAQKGVVEGDEIRISQIFDNLLSNAFRHTPKGGQLLIQTVNENDGMKICIKNEGRLIDPKDLIHLFDPFYSAYEARSSVNSGTGLGLSIVRNLVDKHHGRCGIENIEEEHFEGVEAWVWFPLIQ